MKSLKSFADFLLDLERCSDGRSPDIFQQSAFECLGQCLDFDSGVWASGALTSTGPDFHSVALWRQPAQMLLDYEALKAEDPLFGGRTRASHPGLAAMPAGPAAEHGRPRPSLPAWPAACRHDAGSPAMQRGARLGAVLWHCGRWSVGRSGSTYASADSFLARIQSVQRRLRSRSRRPVRAPGSDHRHRAAPLQVRRYSWRSRPSRNRRAGCSL